MEPLVNGTGGALRDEEGQGAESDPAARLRESRARAISRAIRQEEGVAPGSDVKTYAALRLSIDSWRWSEVPFYLRVRQILPVTATEVVVDLESAAGARSRIARSIRPTIWRRLGPDVARSLSGARAKRPGTSMTGRPVELFVSQYEGDEMESV